MKKVLATMTILVVLLLINSPFSLVFAQGDTYEDEVVEEVYEEEVVEEVEEETVIEEVYEEEVVEEETIEE